MAYIHVIEQAVLLFPLIAFLFMIPYIIYNYHKYGSIFSLRIGIIYSFILYLMCVYFLVILPLPSRAEVAAMTGPRAQLIPFHFIADVLKDGSAAVFQVVFNILMTLPFGMYLRYYFRVSVKKVILYSFLLSLFFELTQLSGLYFIYPRSYRLFDADDLMANTLGGFLGYWAVQPFMKILPTREEIDQTSFRRGRQVSFLRRMTAICLDCIGVILLEVFGNVLAVLCNVQIPYLTWILLIVYFAGIPIIMKGATPGKWITRTRIEYVEGGKAQWYRYALRYGSLVIEMFAFPWLVFVAIVRCYDARLLQEEAIVVLCIIWAGVYCFGIMIGSVRMIMHKPLLYEKISRTVVRSTIEEHRNDEE